MVVVVNSRVVVRSGWSVRPQGESEEKRVQGSGEGEGCVSVNGGKRV